MGLFKWIGSAAKKVGKAALKVAPLALPFVLPGIGGAIGGTVGKVLTGIGGAALGNSSGGNTGGITLGGGKTQIPLNDMFNMAATYFSGNAADKQAKTAASYYNKALDTQSGGLSIMRDALDMQREAQTPMLDMFRKYGVGGYDTALKGLMSSYGYRPLSNGVAGTSMGQAPQAQTAEDNYFKGGSWGYYGDMGQQLGGVTDKYAKAREALQRRMVGGGIPDATYQAALQRIDLAEAEDNRKVQLDSMRQGPMALLNALNPALSMGQTALGAGQSIAGIGNSMGNSGYMMGQLATQMQNGAQADQSQVAQMLQALAKSNVLGGYKAPTMGGSTVSAGIQTPSYTMMPTDPTVDVSSLLAYRNKFGSGF
jgi:hypothetical protein